MRDKSIEGKGLERHSKEFFGLTEASEVLLLQ